MREMEAKVKDTSSRSNFFLISVFHNSDVEIKSSPFNFDVKLGELERSSVNLSLISGSGKSLD